MGEIEITKRQNRYYQRDVRKRMQHMWRTKADPGLSPVGWMTFGGALLVIYDATGLEIVQNQYTMFNGRWLPRFVERLPP